jgi:hypothetical protein
MGLLILSGLLSAIAAPDKPLIPSYTGASVEQQPLTSPGEAAPMNGKGRLQSVWCAFRGKNEGEDDEESCEDGRKLDKVVEEKAVPTACEQAARRKSSRKDRKAEL